MSVTLTQPAHLESDGVTVEPLPYQSDGESLFAAINHLPYAVWLDSGTDRDFAEGRFDIICAQPCTLLTTTGATTTIESRGSKTTSLANPFDLVESALQTVPEVEFPDLPFTGGAVGYFGYHLNRHLEHLPPGPFRDVGVPDMQVGIYEWAVVQDHLNRRCFALFLPTVSDHQRQLILSLLGAKQPEKKSENFFIINKLKPELKEELYYQSLDAIHNYILSGDVYQVNLAQRFSAGYRGNPWQAYSRLRRLLPAPYSAFLKTGNGGAILSHSPELFLQVDGAEVTTKPIKGTRPRAGDSISDQKMIEALANSHKDTAENLMIVDLLRNDLGKHCIPGTIKVPKLFDLQTFKNVHHLVSTVTGTLQPGSTVTQLLRDCFPGGSITGAPKIRAMEIITELEQQERSVYCGSIGYLSRNGKMATNIAIRTLVAGENRLYAWGGGGIVADSKPEAEFQECLDKIGILLDGLSTFSSSSE